MFQTIMCIQIILWQCDSNSRIRMNCSKLCLEICANMALHTLYMKIDISVRLERPNMLQNNIVPLWFVPRAYVKASSFNIKIIKLIILNYTLLCPAATTILCMRLFHQHTKNKKCKETRALKPDDVARSWSRR